MTFVVKIPKGPPKWSVLPMTVKSRMTAVEKKAFQALVKKEREAHAMFHKYEVKPDQASTTKAWKYYAVMFKTIDKAEKMQKKLKAKYAS
jgi:hypothetical protein